jgi:hypothetical protein
VSLLTTSAEISAGTFSLAFRVMACVITTASLTIAQPTGIRDFSPSAREQMTQRTLDQVKEKLRRSKKNRAKSLSIKAWPALLAADRYEFQ